MRNPLALIGLLLLLLACMTAPQSADAATTDPQKFVYNGRLLDAAGDPITTAHSMRFSFWTTADYTSAVINGDGSINTGHATYADWHEVHTVTPNSDGYFSVELGSVTSLWDISTLPVATLLGMYLQVEVKASAAADTAYELLDIDGSSDSIDRSQVDSVPFALNADFIDQREVGTASGDLAILTDGGVWDASLIPIGTNQSSFIIDNDNTEAADITLQFGQTLGKTLQYDQGNSYFDFNDNVNIQGNITLTGTVDGVDISSLASADTAHLKVTDAGGITVNVAEGSYTLRGVTTNYAGASAQSLTDNATNYVYINSSGLQINTSGFPTDQSFIQLAEVITASGDITGISDRRALSSDNREISVDDALVPQYANAAYHADGSDNVGQLVVHYDEGNDKNYYQWTSTRSSLNDYDVVVNYKLPSDFLRWETTALQISYRTASSNIANSKMDIFVYDTNGNSVTLSGSSTDLASTSWTSTSLSFSGSPTWAAGQDFVIRYRLYSKDEIGVHLGETMFHYVQMQNGS